MCWTEGDSEKNVIAGINITCEPDAELEKADWLDVEPESGDGGSVRLRIKQNYSTANAPKPICPLPIVRSFQTQTCQCVRTLTESRHPPLYGQSQQGGVNQ